MAIVIGFFIDENELDKFKIYRTKKIVCPSYNSCGHLPDSAYSKNDQKYCPECGVKIYRTPEKIFEHVELIGYKDDLFHSKEFNPCPCLDCKDCYDKNCRDCLKCNCGNCRIDTYYKELRDYPDITRFDNYYSDGDYEKFYGNTKINEWNNVVYEEFCHFPGFYLGAGYTGYKLISVEGEICILYKSLLQSKNNNIDLDNELINFKNKMDELSIQYNITGETSIRFLKFD